jgi:4-hydroxybenzoyl-CoA reductase beta subunit
MISYDFEYECPATLAEASALLRSEGDGALLMAGGTDLLPNMRIKVKKAPLVVSLAAVAPRAPEKLTDGTLRIDALSRLSDLEGDELLKAKVPMLVEAAHRVGGNQIRQMGTLGGNLCQETRCLHYNQTHDFQFKAPCYKRGGDLCYPFPRNDSSTCWSVYCSDIAPALMVLGAELEIVGPDQTRRMAVGELFTGNGLRPLALEPHEIISAVFVPPAPERTGWGYHKSTVRGGFEFAMTIISVTLRLAEDGKTCDGAAIALGAINEAPQRVGKAEAALAGAMLDDATLAGIAADVTKQINPLPHNGFSRRQLLDNIRVYLKRVLIDAAARARQAAD